MKDYFGWYYWLGLVLEVKPIGGDLVAVVPFVPVGYEIVLKPLGDDIFRMQGGPLDGGRLWFQRSSTGDVMSAQVDELELVKIPDHKVAGLPITERIQAPSFELTEEKNIAFDHLLDEALIKQDGSWINYDLSYPKHEFIQYLTAQDLLIFHGSNQLDISLFEPVRKSIELRDHAGRGNIQGVYGTQDALWAMFFAIVDRSRLQGSIRNGVLYFHKRRSVDSAKSSQLAVYNFSINKNQLSEKPYKTGALYLFSRSSFVRLRMGEAFSNEWVSELPVSPIARLEVNPQDFPFLEQIGGHDDSEVIRWNILGQRIRENTVAASLETDGFVIQLPNTPELSQLMDEFIHLHKIFVPTATIEVHCNTANQVMVIDHLPPAYRQTLSESYRPFLNTNQVD